MNTYSSHSDPIMQAHQRRFATKEYDANRKINEQDFHTILEAGRLSPSSYGLEPWKFLVIQSPELREQLMPIATGAARQLKGASHFVILLARTNVEAHSTYVKQQLLDVQGVSEEMATMMISSLEAFQARWGIATDERVKRDWSSKQTYIALANMLTTAAFLGIDSTPIEGFDYEKVKQLLDEHGLLDNGNFVPSVMAAFGYHKAAPARAKTRKSLDEVVQWV